MTRPLPQELVEELVFEDTWHLEVRALTVHVALGQLRDADGGWGHLYGDRWLGSKPPLHASLSSDCLSRGYERLAAPLPPGTLVHGRGAELELAARWEGRGLERIALPLSPLASQLGLEWLRHDALTVHLHAGDAAPHVPLGSARFSLRPSIDATSGSRGAAAAAEAAAIGGGSGDDERDVAALCTAEATIAAPLAW